MRTLKQFGVLSDLYHYISKDEKLSVEQKNDYLDILKLLNPTYGEVFNGVRFFPTKKEIKLKSFFEGKEGINLIYSENSNFAKYILPKLPETYTISDNCKECYISGYKYEVSVINSSINHIQKIFSINDALAIIADRILITDQVNTLFSEKNCKKLEKTGKENLIFVNIKDGYRELIVTYNIEKEGWNIGLMLPAGD